MHDLGLFQFKQKKIYISRESVTYAMNATGSTTYCLPISGKLLDALTKSSLEPTIAQRLMAPSFGVALYV